MVTVPWYESAELYQRVLEVSVDRADMHPTFDLWRAAAQHATSQLRESGYRIRKVSLCLNAWLLWCEENERPADENSRCQYIASLARNFLAESEDS